MFGRPRLLTPALLLGFLMTSAVSTAKPVAAQIDADVAYRAYFLAVGSGATMRNIPIFLRRGLRPYFRREMLREVQYGVSRHTPGGATLVDCDKIYFPPGGGGGIVNSIRRLTILNDDERHRLKDLFVPLRYAGICASMVEGTPSWLEWMGLARTAYAYAWFGNIGVGILGALIEDPFSISTDEILGFMPFKVEAEQRAAEIFRTYRRPAAIANPLVLDVLGDGSSDLVFLGQQDGMYILTISSKYDRRFGAQMLDPRTRQPITPLPEASRLEWAIEKKDTVGDGFGVNRRPPLIADLNGDGRDDLVFVGEGWSAEGLELRTKLSNGDGTWTSVNGVYGDDERLANRPVSVGDVNGDGRDDLVLTVYQDSGNQGVLEVYTKLSNGDGYFQSTLARFWGGRDWSEEYPRLIADVNGDGKSDLVFVGQDWSGSGLHIRTHLSNGDGTWAGGTRRLGDGPGVHRYPTLVGDVNGDGRDDLVFVGQEWSGSGLNVRTKLSRGDGEWTSRSQVLGDGPGVHVHPTLIGDVNGDGRDDLVFIGQNWSGDGLNVRTKLSNGDGTWTQRSEVIGDGGFVHTFDLNPTRLVDVNDDGKADLVFVGEDWSRPGLNIRTKLSNGDGTWTLHQTNFEFDGITIGPFLFR